MATHEKMRGVVVRWWLPRAGAASARPTAAPAALS